MSLLPVLTLQICTCTFFKMPGKTLTHSPLLIIYSSPVSGSKRRNKRHMKLTRRSVQMNVNLY